MPLLFCASTRFGRDGLRSVYHHPLSEDIRYNSLNGKATVRVEATSIKRFPVPSGGDFYPSTFLNVFCRAFRGHVGVKVTFGVFLCVHSHLTTTSTGLVNGARIASSMGGTRVSDLHVEPLF